MNSDSPSADLKPHDPQERPRAPVSTTDAAVRAYVGYLAGYFELASLAAGRRLDRAGVRTGLLNDV